MIRAALIVLLLAAPAQAARKPPLPSLPPLELPAAAPTIDVEIAGQRVRLTVDFGGDEIVELNPGHPLRDLLPSPDRPVAEPVEKGRYHVAVGQTSLAIPFTREVLIVAGRPVRARVLRPDRAPDSQPAGSAGTIGLPLLPHDDVQLQFRAAMPTDRTISLAARIGRSDAWGFDWRLPDGKMLDVELHPLRPSTVMSAAAASALAAAGDGKLVGDVQRVPISFGAIRPVRMLKLSRAVPIANLRFKEGAVRLFDWAGRSELPPDDAQPDEALPVVGKRGRQGAWRNVKLGRDVFGQCASITLQRDREDPSRGRLTLVCPP